MLLEMFDRSLGHLLYGAVYPRVRHPFPPVIPGEILQTEEHNLVGILVGIRNRFPGLVFRLPGDNDMAVYPVPKT